MPSLSAVDMALLPLRLLLMVVVVVGDSMGRHRRSIVGVSHSEWGWGWP